MAINKAVTASWEDVWLADGVRTPFVDMNGALSLVSPIDMGIKVAREVFKRAEISPEDVGVVIAGSVAQASYDAFMLPRHIGIYAGVPREVPMLLVQRVCGTGFETLVQAADQISLGRADLALCVGTESMSRNPIASYTHRGGFKMGQVEFKDFLWEALMDTAVSCTMGDTAENLAKRDEISREAVDKYAERCFARAVAARDDGFLAGEICSVTNEKFEVEGMNTRSVELPRKVESVEADTHIRPSSYEVLSKLKPAFGGVQTGGNSSGVVDGAGAILVASGAYLREKGKTPLAKIVASAVCGVDPRIMGIGPVPAIQAVCEKAGISIGDVDRFEINEAFGAQIIACSRELNLDEEKLNVNGGAIAIGHPLGATGIRLSLTVARELKRGNLRYGIGSACIGGGQGIAVLVENTEL